MSTRGYRTMNEWECYDITFFLSSLFFFLTRVAKPVDVQKLNTESSPSKGMWNFEIVNTRQGQRSKPSSLIWLLSSSGMPNLKSRQTRVIQREAGR